MTRHPTLIAIGLFLTACPGETTEELEPPEIEILAPTDNSTVDAGEVTVSVIVRHMVIEELDTAVGWRWPHLISVAHAHVTEETPRGYLALDLDGERVADLHATTTTLTVTEAGLHTLDATLYLDDGSPLDPPVFAHVIFTAVETE